MWSAGSLSHNIFSLGTSPPPVWAGPQPWRPLLSKSHSQFLQFSYLIQALARPACWVCIILNPNDIAKIIFPRVQAPLLDVLKISQNIEYLHWFLISLGKKNILARENIYSKPTHMANHPHTLTHFQVLSPWDNPLAWVRDTITTKDLPWLI